MKVFSHFLSVLCFIGFNAFSQTPSNDDFVNAEAIPHTANWCSSGSPFTTINATSDGTKGSEWRNGPNYNVWYKFQATTTQVNAEISTGGPSGSLRYPFLGLWDDSGTEITSATYHSSTGSINVQSNNLTIGNWYYISVDNYSGSSYSGSFTLCVANEVNYDYMEKAVEVPHTSIWCSADGEYSTINATPDGVKGSVWRNGPNYNIWFKFQATTTEVNAQINIGGSYGSLRYPFLALWDASGTEITSSTYYSSTGTINVQSDNLTIGNWYYISVDNHSGSNYRGSFTLCVDDTVNNDFKDKAIELPHTADWCSADAEYTTINASADEAKGTAWNNGPNYNLWYKFQATTTEVNAQINIGGSYGSLRYPYLALWDDSNVEIASSAYYSSTGTINVQSDNLTIGNWYYISVDNHSNSSYRGSFTLCIDDEVNNDFKHKAIELPHTSSWCSADAEYTTINASPDETKGSEWNNGPNYNLWYKFQATTTEVKAEINIGGSAGSLRYPFMALWDDSGTELMSSAYYSSTGNINVQSSNLTIGNWYYVSVDNHSSSSYRGSFALCIYDQVDYDFYEGAIDVTGIINSCSLDEEYTTIGASADRAKGSNWNNNGPKINRWFKFTAPATGEINVTVDIGGAKGSQKTTQLALWAADGTTEITSKRYAYNTEDVVMGANGLTPGETYYISVDAYHSGYSGTFTLCLQDQLDYDFYEGAIDVTSIINSCSLNEAYTTIGASPDRNKGSNWNNNGPKTNRWFKFTAPATGEISVTVDIGGDKGTQKTTQVALWASDGITEINSKRYAYNTEDVVLGANGLNPGDIYYISVDAYHSGYSGSFTLCVQDQLNYDYYEGAIEITSIINSCSADAEYTTVGASPDRNKGSNWNNNGPKNNRWFKFTAPATGQIEVIVDVGAEKGTQKTTQIALWETDGLTELSSNRYVSNTDDVILGYTSLTPGEVYYVSVDVYNSSYDGTFTLCVKDSISYDFYEGAIDITELINTCSEDAIYDTTGATPDKVAGSNWNNSGPKYNRWFKFTAPETGQISITVDVDGTKGTQRRTQVAMWEDGGTVEVDSKRYTTNNDDVVVSGFNLTPGATYYVSVDAYSGNTGTFTLCVENTFVDFNGTDYYVDFGDNHDLSRNFSLEAWVLQKSTSAKATIMSKGDVALGALRGYHFTLENGYPSLLWYNNSGIPVLTIISPNQIENNKWYHVAATYTRNTVSLYVDGVLVATSVSASAPSNNSYSFLLGASYDSSTPNTPKYCFDGYIDEVRIWNVALSKQQIRQMMNQEIVQSGTGVRGKLIASNISDNLLWANLKGYYPMANNAASDFSSNNINGYSKNNRASVQEQTAPLPYVTSADGPWASSSTWLHGDVWNISNLGDDNEWGIVQIKNNISIDRDINTMGLFIDSGKTLTVNGTRQVKNEWYFELNGTLDLMEDSQLIQTINSNLVTSATGKLLRRQEGTASPFWYNYWSAPIGTMAATSLTDDNASNNNPNNTSYKLNMLKDESGFNLPFTSGHSGNGSISTAWLYTFKNGVTYWDWKAVSPTSPLSPGVGYTQKGTGSPGNEQQYIFEGKPNNGTVLIDVVDKGGVGSVPNKTKTEYLVGNPYASALDLHQFIDDNAGVIDGTIYLWQQWAGNSHYLNEYQGGYAQVNKLGGCRAYQFVGIEGNIDNSKYGVIVPTRYVSVGQGFVVEVVADGQVEFNNGQRVFIKEADANGTYDQGSIFSKSTKSSKSSKEKIEKSEMQKIRLEFNSVTGPKTRRELLLGFSNYTKDDFDFGYDAKCTETNNNDLNLALEGKGMVMQAYSPITDDKVIPLNFKSSGKNSFEIKISEKINIPENQAIYIKDNLTGEYFDLSQDGTYQFSSEPGVFNSRFEIVFQDEQQALSTEEAAVSGNFVYYQNSSRTFYAKKLSSTAKHFALINMRGQNVLELKDVTPAELEQGIRFDNVATGAYVVCIRTENNELITKKVVVN